MREEKKIWKLQRWTLFVAVVLISAKGFAYLITDSDAIFSDFLESFVNLFASAFALYSLYYSGRPKDQDHPYGHGKMEFISSGIEGVLILIAGLGIVVKATLSFFVFNAPPAEIGLGIVISAGAGIINFGWGWWIEREGLKVGSLVLEAEGKHLKSDAYTSVGMIIGLFALLWTGWSWIDQLLAIAFAAIIIYTGVQLIRKSLSGIMDKADYRIIENLVEVLQNNRKSVWIDVHNLRVIKYGRALHIDCHVTLPYYLSLEKAHDEIDAIEKLIDANFPRDIELFIHSDPCIESSCSICSLAECNVRKEAFRGTVAWELTNVMSNKKHDKSLLAKRNNVFKTK